MGDPILDAVQQQQAEPVTPPTVPRQDTKPKEPGTFGKILGSVLGGAMNVIAPGAGSLIGGLVRGGGLNYAADMEVMQRPGAQQTQ